jgi:hypothetical protein
MYSVTHYISAAIHNGTINPQVVIDRLEDVHRADNVELGIDEKELLEEAKKAKTRNTIFSFLMVFPAIYIVLTLFEFFDRYYSGLDALFKMTLPPLLLVAAAVFVKQVSVTSYIKKLANSTLEHSSNENRQNVIISGGYSPFSGYGFD